MQLYLSTCSDSSVVSSFNERCQDSNNRSRSQDFEYWNREYQRYGEKGKEGRQVYDDISYAACTDQEMRDRNNCLLKHMDRRQKKYRRPRYSQWITIQMPTIFRYKHVAYHISTQKPYLSHPRHHPVINAQR